MKQFHNIKVVAFDCDGVMFDSKNANMAYYNHILDHFGLNRMTEEQIEYAQMHTVNEALEYVIEDPETLLTVHAYRKKMSYLPFIKHMNMEPGLVPLLKKLRPGYKTAVATNRTDTMDRVLSDYHLVPLFDLVICALDVTFPKPHPESLNKVIQHFNIEPDQMVYIGDSELDQMASRQAGAPFIAYDNKKLDADLHIGSLREIEPILDL